MTTPITPDERAAMRRLALTTPQTPGEHAYVEHVPRLLDALDTAEAEVARLTPPCDGGCSYGDGPAEDCSAHGRPVAEVWEVVREVQRQRDEARAATSPAWDEDTVTEAATEAMMRLHECGYPVTLGSPDCEMHGVPFLDTHIGDVYGVMSASGGYCPEARRWADTVLAVVRRHLPVRPDRATVLRALAHADGQDLEGYDLGHTAEMQYGAQADAVLAEWPGESRAQVQAAALRDAATQLVAEDNNHGDWWDSDGQTYVTPDEWLRARADRIEKEK